MANKDSRVTAGLLAQLTANDMRLGIRRLQRRLEDLRLFNPEKITRQNYSQISALAASIDDALVSTFGPDTVEYYRYRTATDFQAASLMIGDSQSPFDIAEELTDGINQATAMLTQAIRSLEEKLEDMGEPIEVGIPQGSTTTNTSSKMRIGGFRDGLLIGLARRDAVQARYYDLKKIAEEDSLTYIDGWIRKVAEQLRDAHHINATFTSGGIHAEITAVGIEAAEGLGEIYADLEQTQSTVPAADRYVSLDHNSQPYKNTIQAIENTRDAVQRSNEYGEADPEDKNQQISELNAGLALLKSVRVRVTAAMAVVLPPLVYLAQKFMDSTIGELANQAITFARTLLGI